MTESDRGELLLMLKQAEGLRLKPYIDTVGKITIGYGRNLTDNGINQEEADAMLQQDVDRHLSDLLRACPWVTGLDATREMVLSEMAFNLGVPRLLGFVKMLEMVKQRMFHAAALEMLNSAWAQQVGARATRLASAMESGEWK